MCERVLLVDDDPLVLAAARRQLHRWFEVETCPGAAEGLDAVQTRGPFAVIVSDMRMPGIDGLQFLVQAQALAPQSVRMMLTGDGDMNTAVNAINEGSIFRFIRKPCPPEMLAQVIEAGIEQYRLVRAEKDLIERTLQGSIKVLTEILSLVTPVAFGRASRVRRTSCEIAARLTAPHAWQIELAAMLSQIGCVTVPTEILVKAYRGRMLSREQEQVFRNHPWIGSELLKNIPRLEPIAEIILYQEKHFDGSGPPSDSRRGKSIPLGARILKVALDHDALSGTGTNAKDAMAELTARGRRYDPEVLEVLAEVIDARLHYKQKLVELREVVPGMILAQDLRTASGLLLLAKGQEITCSLCTCLKDIGRREPDMEKRVAVLVATDPVAQTSLHFDIHPPIDREVARNGS